MTGIETTTRFAGLTRHNNTQISDRAAEVSDVLYPDDMPDRSLAGALRDLERADNTETAWKVPAQLSKKLDAAEVDEASPRDVTAFEGPDGQIWVKSPRFKAVYSPEKIRHWLRGDWHDEESGLWKDPLWNIPTKKYTIVNPMDFYEPLERELRDQELGDSLFGEVRSVKSGGEVHIEILFDSFNIPLDDVSGGPILLGLRTGFDYFGNYALYAEGFAQDRACVNSIRSVTDKKTRRHVGNPEDVREWWQDILKEMDLMTSHLAEVIEAANNITLEYTDMEFAEVYSHEDDLQAFFQLLGFPEYLAQNAASHVRSRAQDEWEPTMWDVHSGATYSVSHQYRGGENTSTLDEYVRSANDLLMNPSQAMEEADQRARERFAAQQATAQSEIVEDEQKGELDALAVSAKVEQFQQSIEDQREEFETRQEELKDLLAQEAE